MHPFFLSAIAAASLGAVQTVHPVAHGGHVVSRGGHRLQSFLLDRAQTDAAEPEANTPLGNFWWMGASSTSTSAIPNNGVRMEADVVTTPAGAAGGCFSVWTSDVLSNDMWGQIGYSACDIPGDAFHDLTSFFQVWDLSVGTDGLLLVDQESSDITPGLHSFAMYVQSGTTWAYAVDGNVMGAVDMGSSTGNAPNGVMTLAEEGDGVAEAFAPPSVAVPVAMEVMSGGTWGPAAAATVLNTAGLSGVSGNLQDSTLADDQIVIGGSSPTLQSGAALWNGVANGGGISTTPDAGAVSEPFVQITCPSPNATVGGTVVIPIIATSPDGIASVTVSAESATDLDGGSAVSPCNLTTPPFNCDWNTAGESDGQYYLFVVATDNQGNATYETMLLNVGQTASSQCSPLSDAGSGGGSGSGGSVDSGSRNASDAGVTPGNGGGPAPLADSGTDGDPGAGASSDSPFGGGDAGCSCDAVGGNSFPAGACWGPLLLGVAIRVRRRDRVGARRSRFSSAPSTRRD